MKAGIRKQRVGRGTPGRRCEYIRAEADAAIPDQRVVVLALIWYAIAFKDTRSILLLKER